MNIKTFYDSFPQAVRIVLSNGKSFPAVEVCESFEKISIISIQLHSYRFICRKLGKIFLRLKKRNKDTNLNHFTYNSSTELIYLFALPYN